MPDIVLTTLNAKYAHAAFGLRYLLANLGPLRDRAEIVEFDVSQRSVDILERLLERRPQIVGLGIYIWNVEPATRIVAELKRVAPEIVVILGGPEVSYETDDQEIVRLADYVITGEADRAFRQLCKEILANCPQHGAQTSPSPPRGGRAGVGGASGESTSEAANDPSPQLQPLHTASGTARKIIPAPLPDFADLALPYDLYTAEDIAHRVLYVEASRGCPYECEFCLSSLDIPVRAVALEAFLGAMQPLLDRGASQFKFVDRTFNLNVKTSRAILEFFLERYRPGLFLHFEMIPDRFPEALRDPVRRFPEGALQFEVGIQTFNEEVAALISRRQNNALVAENLGWLRRETGVHVHADLIVGLPGESVESFASGFDRLVTLAPQEIQVGMLKRLRGTPIVRHDAAWGMVYSPAPPYEILRTKLIDYASMQKLRRFARYWDLVANSGNFVETAPLLWRRGSPFESFLRFSDWLYAASGRTNAIALKRLAELVFEFLTDVTGCDEREAASAVWHDYRRGGRSDRPEFLRPYLADLDAPPGPHTIPPRLARQARHRR